MNVTTITMPKAEALAAYRTYREHAKTNQDRAIATGYRAIARGKAIINAREAIIKAGFDALCRPLLAIARADRQIQSCQVASREVYFRDAPEWQFTLPEDRYTRERWIRYTAQVPLIPCHLRPAEKQLRNYWILWEADWNAAPRDPLLLKKLSGDLYVVLAAWDLTELERAAMGRIAR